MIGQDRALDAEERDKGTRQCIQSTAGCGVRPARLASWLDASDNRDLSSVGFAWAQGAGRRGAGGPHQAAERSTKLIQGKSLRREHAAPSFLKNEGAGSAGQIYLV